MVRMHENNGSRTRKQWSALINAMYQSFENCALVIWKQCISHLKAVFHMIDYGDDTNNTLFFIRLK